MVRNYRHHNTTSNNMDVTTYLIRIKVANKIRIWKFKASWPTWVYSIMEDWHEFLHG